MITKCEIESESTKIQDEQRAGDQKFSNLYQNRLNFFAGENLLKCTSKVTIESTVDQRVEC